MARDPPGRAVSPYACKRRARRGITTDAKSRKDEFRAGSRELEGHDCTETSWRHNLRCKPGRAAVRDLDPTRRSDVQQDRRPPGAVVERCYSRDMWSPYHSTVRVPVGQWQLALAATARVQLQKTVRLVAPDACARRLNPPSRASASLHGPQLRGASRREQPCLYWKNRSTRSGVEGALFGQ